MREVDKRLLALAATVYNDNCYVVNWRTRAAELPVDDNEMHQAAAEAVFETFVAMGGEPDSLADWERLGPSIREPAGKLFYELALGKGSAYWDTKQRMRHRTERVSVDEFQWDAWRCLGDCRRRKPRHTRNRSGYNTQNEWDTRADSDEVSAALAAVLKPDAVALLLAVYYGGRKPIDLARDELQARGQVATTDNVRRAERAIWKRLSRARKVASALLPEQWKELAAAA